MEQEIPPKDQKTNSVTSEVASATQDDREAFARLYAGSKVFEIVVVTEKLADIPLSLWFCRQNAENDFDSRVDPATFTTWGLIGRCHLELRQRSTGPVTTYEVLRRKSFREVLDSDRWVWKLVVNED